MNLTYVTTLQEVVAASPQTVEWGGLDSDRINEKLYRKLYTDKRKQLVRGITPSVNLYRLPTKYFAIDEQERRVIYYVQFEHKMFLGQRGVTQILLWREPLFITKGLTEDLFFNHIMPTSACIVTDGQQTPAGQRFWLNRITEAFAKGLKVYLLDQNTQTPRLIKTEKDFRIAAKDWWGVEPKHQAKKVAICREELWT